MLRRQSIGEPSSTFAPAARAKNFEKVSAFTHMRASDAPQHSQMALRLAHAVMKLSSIASNENGVARMIERERIKRFIDDDLHRETNDIANIF